MKVSTVAATGILAGTGTPRGAAAPRPPNILFILADDLGWGDLSCFGSTDLRTPHIDRIATEGIRFTEFYANCCVCSPTRAAILTGRFQEFVGVPGVIRTNDESNWGHLIRDCTLLPDVLRRSGYRSALIGKWHLGLESPNIPTERGFDVFRGFLGDMMDDYHTHRRHGINYMRNGTEVVDPEGHATDLFTAWAEEELEAFARDERPFFMMLAYNAPHTPIQPPDHWLRAVTDREPDLPEVRARLVALIEHLDDGVGRVLDALDRLGLADRTLVLFTSDNGGQLNVGACNGPYRSGKGHMYDGGIRIPMCARFPGTIPAGTVTDFRALTMDLFPTFAEAAGAEFDAPVDGQSLLPALRGEPLPPFERTDFYSWLQGTRKEALRKGRWKLVRDVPGTPFELYDMDADPLETRNRATENPEVYAQLLREMQTRIGEAAMIPWRRPPKP